MADMGLRSCDVGNIPTFTQGGRTSIVDVTFATANIAGRLKESWKVDKRAETLGDHRYVTFREPGRPQRASNGKDAHSRRAGAEKREGEGWCLKKLKVEKFRENMRKSVTAPQEEGTAEAERRSTPEEQASRLRARIKEACDAAAPRRKRYDGKKSVYWWSEETAETRRRCMAARRRLQRTRPRPGSAATAQREEEYSRARKQMRLTIRKEKEKAWKEMIDTIEGEPWGTPYKICMGKLRPRHLLHRNTVEEAVDKLFPDGQGPPQEPPATQTEGEREDARPDADAEGEVPAVTAEEVSRAFKRTKTRKAP